MPLPPCCPPRRASRPAVGPQPYLNIVHSNIDALEQQLHDPRLAERLVRECPTLQPRGHPLLHLPKISVLNAARLQMLDGTAKVFCHRPPFAGSLGKASTTTSSVRSGR